MSGRSPCPPRRDAHRLGAAVLAVLLAGCAATPAGPATTPGGAMTPVEPDPAPSGSSAYLPPGKSVVPTPSISAGTPGEPGSGDAVPPTGPVPPEALERTDVQAALAAEATRTGAASTAVRVAGYFEVTWTDGSLGCPQPGMMYPQALVPGSLLVLEVDGRLASYHAARDQPFTYCARPVLPPSDVPAPNA